MARRAGTGLVLVLLVLTAGGCGGSAKPAGRTVVFHGGGTFPPSTIAGTYSAEGCREDALQIVRQAHLFYVHSTSEPGPADLYYYDLRFAYDHFEADACPSATLGEALNRHLTPRARRFLLHNVTSNLERVFQKALGAARGRTSS